MYHLFPQINNFEHSCNSASKLIRMCVICSGIGCLKLDNKGMDSDHILNSDQLRSRNPSCNSNLISTPTLTLLLPSAPVCFRMHSLVMILTTLLCFALTAYGNSLPGDKRKVPRSTMNGLGSMLNRPKYFSIDDRYKEYVVIEKPVVAQ